MILCSCRIPYNTIFEFLFTFHFSLHVYSRDTLLILFLDERNEHTFCSLKVIQSRKITDVSSRVFDKESARVPQKFREKPFVVSKVLKGEGKKDKAEKNLNLNYLLILNLLFCDDSVKSINISTFRTRLMNFLFNYVMLNY